MKDLSNIRIQDIEDTENTDFYDRFRDRLMQVEQFPTLYTFKFIIPTDESIQEKVTTIFTHPSTKIQEKDSKTGKYQSLTIEVFVNNADEVIEYYKKASAIDKVMML